MKNIKVTVDLRVPREHELRWEDFIPLLNTIAQLY